jgi:hypothetical protein
MTPLLHLVLLALAALVLASTANSSSSRLFCYVIRKRARPRKPGSPWLTLPQPFAPSDGTGAPRRRGGVGGPYLPRKRVPSVALFWLLGACLFQAQAAEAACSASNTYNYSFNWASNTTLNYATAYTYTASNTLGANQNFTLSFATNGLSSTQVNSVQMPTVNDMLSGAAGGRTLVIGGTFSSRTADVSTNTRVIRTVFTFATPIRDMTIRVHDIDQAAGQYRDWLMIQGANGASTYTPSLTTPQGSNNTAGGPHTASGSTLALGAYTATGINIPNTQGVGLSTSANTGSDDGDIVISFPQPVTSVTLRYGNHPLIGSESGTGQQAYGISALSFCPMPNLTMAKTSAPYATTGSDRFNAPLADVAYTLTVTNSGGSPVDLGGITLTDALPPTVSFYNGDYDPALPGTDPFLLTAGTSGVTLAAANVTYSNNGGTSSRRNDGGQLQLHHQVQGADQIIGAPGRNRTGTPCGTRF